MTTQSETPSYLDGVMAPVPDEIDAVDLHIEGSLPPELTGRYFRNGPNPLPGDPPGHWFTGAGMVHGIRLLDGKAQWYRNRWVKTRELEGATFFDGTTFDYTAVPANTSIQAHAGRIMALVENGFPYLLDGELGTIGPYDFDGRLTGSMTAHPKLDPQTGELHFFGYSAHPPFVVYHRLDSTGHLVASREIDVPQATMMHDFAITENHVVWLDLPMTFSMDLAKKGGMPYGWDEKYTARLGVMNHRNINGTMEHGGPQKVQWFDIDPCYIFHVGGAHEDGAGRIVLDAPRYSPADAYAMWGGIGGRSTGTAIEPALGVAEIHRWTLDTATGTSRTDKVDDRYVEFPTIDAALVGRPARYRYVVTESGLPEPQPSGILKYDLDTGSYIEHSLGTTTVAGEAVFVPSAAPGRAEDDGWLLSITTERDGSGSKLLVLDATDVSGNPVAAVTLPRRVPAGFHGAWIPD